MIFKTNITGIGSEAEQFKSERLIILFGEGMPAELADYCYTISLKKASGNIQNGMHIHFDDQSYEITSVGNAAEHNLNELGHISIKFNGAKEADLPGTLYVEDRQMPNLRKGMEITITA